jgi:AcrR family transcriptional regulator
VEYALAKLSRSYKSSVRAEVARATRRAVLDAARALFSARGIDAVTVAEIAARAGVGTSTVYAAFLSKEGVLRALMQASMFGERYDAARARLDAESDPVVVLTRTAEVARVIYEGESDALGLLRGASAFAPSLRAVEEEFEALRYEMQRERIVRLRDGGHLAPTLALEDARRIVWALTNRELYRSLVLVGGWPSARYERWLGNTLCAQLLARPPAIPLDEPGPCASEPQGEPTMKKPRVIAPALTPGEKVKGPALYFPSIEKTYGRPVQAWLDVVADRLLTERHMDVVTWLKETHGLGHGHANALVAYVRAHQG